MDWLNLHTSTLDGPEVLGSDPVQRATWLMLLRYCIGQENSGMIIGAASWGDRKWQQLVRVTKREVSASSDLWEWNDGDLAVWGYPIEKEREIVSKRETAKLNGRSGGRPKNQRETNVGYSTEPKLVISGKAEGEGKGKGKGREGEDTSEPTPAPDLKIYNRECVRRVLRKAGLPSTDTAIEEWRDMMTGIGGCGNIDEILRGMTWIISEGLSRGHEITYAKHARMLADEWAEKQTKSKGADT
jgi:hypothetical protein